MREINIKVLVLNMYINFHGHFDLKVWELKVVKE